MQKSRLLSKNEVKLENFNRNLNQTKYLLLLQRSLMVQCVTLAHRGLAPPRLITYLS